MDFNVATKASSAKRAPGLVELWFCKKDELSTIAVPLASPSTQAEKVTIDGPHVATVGNGFQKLYISTRKSKGMWATEGDQDSKSVKHSVEVFVPGMTKEIAALLFDDPEMIVLYPNGPCGTSEYLQIGTKCDGGYIEKAEGGTETFGGTNAKGTTLTISASQSAIYFYNDAIPEL